MLDLYSRAAGFYSTTGGLVKLCSDLSPESISKYGDSVHLETYNGGTFRLWKTAIAEIQGKDISIMQILT